MTNPLIDPASQGEHSAPDFTGGRGRSPRGGGCNTPPSKTNVDPEAYREFLLRELHQDGLTGAGREQILRSLGGNPELVDAASVLGPAREKQQLAIDLVAKEVKVGDLTMWMHKGVYFFTLDEVRSAPEAGAPPGQPAALEWIEHRPTFTPDPEDPPTALAWAIDSLYVCVFTELTPAIVARLVALRAMARQKDIDSVYVWGQPRNRPDEGRQWKVEWTKPPYALRLECPQFASVRIAKSAAGDGPQVYVEFRAIALWQYGARYCIDVVVDMLRGWSPPGANRPRVTISRLDMAVDVVNHGLTGSENAEGRYVCQTRWRRTRAKANESPGERKARKARERERSMSERDAVTMVHGREFSGERFGGPKSPVALVIYDKTLEIRNKGGLKSWQYEFWNAGGWDGEAPVFRFELRFDGEALKSMVANSSELSAIVADPDDPQMRVWEPGGATVGNEDWAVWRGLDGLWRYGVGHWCTLKAPDGGKRPARWPMAENWRHIVAGPRWGPVVNVLGAQFVTIGRQRRRPLKSSKVGEGEAKRSALQLDLAGVTTGDGTINVIESEPGVVAWGDGIASEDKAKKLRAAADQAGIELDVISAEARRDRLLPQIIGTIATYAGAHAVAVRNQGEPMDLLDACFLVAERAELDPEIHAAFREKQRLARHRAAFTGAIRVRRSMAQDYGKKKPKKAEQEFNEKRDRWEYPRKKG